MWPWSRRVDVVQSWPGEWPLRLTGRTPSGVAVILRPLRLDDEAAYLAVRRDNVDWLGPWDATAPRPTPTTRSFGDLVAHHEAEAAQGRSLPFVVEVDGEFVGQLNVSNIVRGSFWSCAMGYWVARAWAGQGITPTAVAMAGDHCFGVLGLHRIEINIRPENVASLAVVRKLGLRDEGLRPRYLHIDGDWRDHRSFAVTADELGGSTLRERLTQSSQQSLLRHTDPAPPA